MTAARKTVAREEIQSAIEACYAEAWRTGSGWVYARAYPDGEIITGREVSRLIPETEYYRREPHPVTFFDKPVRPGDCWSAWGEVYDAEGNLLPSWEGYTEEQVIEELINQGLDDLDLTNDLKEAFGLLEDAGYTIE